MLRALQIDTSVSEKHAVSIFIPEGGHSMFLQNGGIFLKVYEMLQPRKLTSTSVPP
jgi:hypothetical protein